MLLASNKYLSELFVLQSITVADYSWQFFERVLQNKYGDTEEENAQKAGENFHSEPGPVQQALQSCCAAHQDSTTDVQR